MGQTERAARAGSMKIVVVAAVAAAVLLGAFLYLSLGGAKPTTTTHEDRHSQENTPQAARESLAKKTDLNTCRNALDQFNSYYAQTIQEHPWTLDTTSQDALQQLCGLEPDEIAEIAGNRYTLLDACHLDQCFLMRDAARSLEPELRGPDSAATKLTPLEEATLAFKWVVRQIRLQDGFFLQVPPSFALRRGWGTELDRAHVFLTLLEQLGNSENGKANASTKLFGCLVTVPGKDNRRLWACGVVVGDEKELYLFDPRLGLPLPGPNGTGVATLAQVRNDPKVLAQLQIKGNIPYDVTPELAQMAEVHLACPLSALAPRLRFLQEKVLAPQVRVNLAVDVLQNEKKVKAAVGEAHTIKVDKASVSLPRQFLSKEKGGVGLEQPIHLNQLRGFVESNDPSRAPLSWENAFTFELAPWNELWPEFRDQRKFPANIGLGQTVRMRFLEPFRSFTLDPDSARDQMLRGHYRPAVKQLSQERDECSQALKGLSTLDNDPDLRKKIEEWLVNRAEPVFANQLRAKTPADREKAAKEVEIIWQEEPIATLLPGLAARARRPEATYYLALCKHELAEQAQARLDLAARLKGATPAQAKEWPEAQDWWQRFVEEYPNAPEREAARRLLGRAQLLAGNREAAIETWEGDAGTGSSHALEKLACLYLAEQARKK